VIKRSLTLVATVCATVATWTAIVPTASYAALGDAPCTWTVNGIPANYRIGLDHPTVRIGGTCTNADNWLELTALKQATGAAQYVPGSTMSFQGCTTAWIDPDTNWCHDVRDPDPMLEYPRVSTAVLHLNQIGLFLTVPTREYTIDEGDTYNHASTFSSQYLRAKLATKTSMTVTPAGSRRTFTITAQHYSRTAKKFVTSYNQPVYLERYINGAWSIFRTLESDSSPIVFSTSLATAYTWLARTPGTTTRWGSRSVTTKI
jgi:hypothetical protein